jgi:hypothetical protein
MSKKFHTTLSIGLSGLLVLGLSVAYADTTRRAPNVLHEMVPHVVLPETIQYNRTAHNRTANNLPGAGRVGVTSPHVATYVAFPSYQVPHTTVFRPVGQSVYPVSPQVPPPLPRVQPEPDTFAIEFAEFAIEDVFARQELDGRDDGRDIVLSDSIAEPIRLASSATEVIPTLPRPDSVSNNIVQTGIFRQAPARPPSAWAFSSPIFRMASVPGSWGGQQTGSITHHSPLGGGQHVGFMPAGGGAVAADPSMAGGIGAGGYHPHGIPYTTFQLGRMRQQETTTPQVNVLPNGMLLLTLPPSHHNCGPLRCRPSCAPRTILLPPTPGMMHPGMMHPGMMPMAPTMHNAIMNGAIMNGNGVNGNGMNGAMMHGPGGMPLMPVAHQPQMMPVMAMTPMGPAVVGFQQVGFQQVPQMPMMQQPQMAFAMPNPMMAAQRMAAQMPAMESADDALPPPAWMGVNGNGNGELVPTPFGYVVQAPEGAMPMEMAQMEMTQMDVAMQLAQMQQMLFQMQMQMKMQMQMQMMNPHAAPFGHFGQGHFGQPAMFPHQGVMPNQGGGMSVSDMLMIMTLLNNNQPQQRPRLMDRMMERREARRAMMHHDPVTQLMQAWTTPHVAPGTTLRMPSRNAFPYGYFGVQAMPMTTANYGGFHNFHFGHTTFPGVH